MRWKIASDPEEGARRTVKKFAWVPVNIDGELAVWLEPYWQDQTYREHRTGGFWYAVRNKLEEWR